MGKWFTLDVLRQILMVAGAIAVGLGWKDDQTVQTIIGIIMSIVSAVWQLFDHSAVQTEVKSLRDEVKSLKGLK
jgi:hypothetical protein